MGKDREIFISTNMRKFQKRLWVKKLANGKILLN